MPNINQIPPSDISVVEAARAPADAAGSGNILHVDPSDIQTPEEAREEKFGSAGQQALTVAEGLGHGFAGPVATGLESGLSGLGVPGLSPEEQRARAEVNPVEHYGSEIAGFGAGALTGTGEAALLGRIGEGAAGFTGLSEGANLVSKIATTGIKTGSEIAALQAGDEISKAINQDPNQTLGSAAINIGLAGIIGGAGGSVLGSVSPLFKTAANKLGVTKFANDFMGELKFLQDNPNVEESAAKELADRHVEVEQLKTLAPEASENVTSQLSSRKKALGEEPFVPTYWEPIKNFHRPGAPLFFDKEAAKETLNSSQKLADKIAKNALEDGTEIPPEAILNPTPALNAQTGKAASPGQLFARWAYSKGSQTLANAIGETAGSAVGGLAGSIVGHPIVGALGGEKLLASTFSALAKPFAEKAVNSEAMRASVDYVANAVKGDAILNKSVKDFFTTGEVVPKFLVPSLSSREKLEKSLASTQNPENMMRVGGNIGHYMPDHSTAAAALAASATEYLNALKPKQAPLSPFDATPPIDKVELSKYNRALDIAQQPLMVLKYAKDGTLLPQDVQTIQTIYPGLHSSMVAKINNELINQQTSGNPIPYGQRVSLSTLTGSILDSTMIPLAMQAVIKSAGTQQAAVQANKSKRSNATGAELKAIEKSSSLYPTALQQHQINKRS